MCVFFLLFPSVCVYIFPSETPAIAHCLENFPSSWAISINFPSCPARHNILLVMFVQDVSDRPTDTPVRNRSRPVRVARNGNFVPSPRSSATGPHPFAPHRLRPIVNRRGAGSRVAMCGVFMDIDGYF